MADSFERFPRPDGIYLLNHSVGVPPSSLQSQLADGFVEDWLSNPHNAWPRWVDEIEGRHRDDVPTRHDDVQALRHVLSISALL